VNLSSPPQPLPAWVTWRRRPFPDANLLLLHGREPALVDSGFTGHAKETAAWARAHTGHLALVVNTHWHSDHVGGNALLQARGAGIAAGAQDAQAVARRDAGCCSAEYLDQPVSPYTVDVPLDDGQVVRLGDADWQVVRTPGHTPGHLSLWQPEERLLVVGDAEMAPSHASARARDLVIGPERGLHRLLDHITVDRKSRKDDLDEHGSPPLQPGEPYRSEH